ncbi:MAG TPA: hypothetical protein VGJ84_19455 [Polyangiaceae bacterium]|jgi:hypothetical protein
MNETMIEMEALAGLRRLSFATAAVGALGAGIALAISGPRAALGVLCGSCLAAVNLWAMTRLVTAFLTGRGPKAPWAVLASLKFIAVLACAALLVWSTLCDLSALAIGYTALPLGIVVGYASYGVPLRRQG